MVFHWNLSDIKSPHVSRTLLSILAHLNNGVVWIFSTRLLISQTFYQSFGDCTNRVYYSWYNCHCYVSQFFSIPSKDQVLIILFASFQLYSVVRTAKSTILQVLFFFVDYYKVRSSGRDLVICLYVKIQKEYVYFILQERFWAVHTAFVCMVKFQFLAGFPVDRFAYPVVSSLIFFLS